MRSAGWSSRTAASSTRTATACSARYTTPRTRSRTRCCGHGAACPVRAAAARCAPGSTRSPPTPASTSIGRRPQARAADRLRPAADPHDGPGEPLVESVWIEPYPDERLGRRGRLRRARGALRAARGRRARVRRRAAAPAGRASARRSSCARCSASRRSEVADALETTVASVNSALQRARKTVDGAAARAQPAGHAALARRRRRCASSSSATWMRWQRGDVDAVVAMLAEDAAWSMPPLASWFRGLDAITALPRRGPLSGEWRWRHIAARANGQPAVGVYSWDAEDGSLPAVRARRADARRRPDQGGHRFHRALDRGAPIARYFARWPEHDRWIRQRGGRVRALRPARPARLSDEFGRRAGFTLKRPTRGARHVREHQGVQRLRCRRPAEGPGLLRRDAGAEDLRGGRDPVPAHRRRPRHLSIRSPTTRRRRTRSSTSRSTTSTPPSRADGARRGVPALRRHRTGRKGHRPRRGPAIAWFEDPAGNILSVLETL